VAGGNRIHQFLEEAGIDWRQPMADFVRRYGVTRCPWLDIDIVLVGDGARLLRGLLRPPEFRVAPQWAPNQPPLEFFGLAHVAPDWRANFEAALNALGARLGPPETDDNSNSRGRRWRDGNAEITIRSWPPELQFVGVNLMHQREPRTRAACHVTVATGFRPECTPGERAMLDSFVEVAALPAASGHSDKGPSQYELEYFRALPEDLHHLRGRIGRAGDRVAWARTDLHLVPLEEVKGLTLLHCLPARGSGYGGVEVACVSSAAGGSEKSLKLGVHDRVDGLDAWASGLAKALDLPVQVQEFSDD